MNLDVLVIGGVGMLVSVKNALNSSKIHIDNYVEKLKN